MAAHHLKRSQGARFGVYAGRVLLQYARCAVALIYLPSAAFTLDTYTHVTEQMKRGAAEKIGVFMNASVNVQVNVVHSPSAVVRGDYESDLANCLNPSNSTDLDPTSQ